MTDPTGPRWPWLAAAALIVVAAAAMARSVWLHWQPCHGPAMWRDLIIVGGSEVPYSDACLRRMDVGLPYAFPTEVAERTPGAFAWGSAAMIALALVWLVLSVGLRLRLPQRALLLVPGLLQLVIAAVAIHESGDLSWGADQYSRWEWLNWLTEPAAIVVLALLAWCGPLTGTTARLLIIAWAATAGGTFHQIGDYVVAANLNQANWDNPPGTGFVTVVCLLLAAVVVVVLALRPHRSTHPAEPLRVAAPV